MSTPSNLLARKYYLHLAAAFVRGKLIDLPQISDEETLSIGLQKGLRLHKFKRSAELPRVRKVLGILRAFNPASLLDVGVGRGVFLWPLLNEFPELPVHVIDARQDRIDDVRAVAAGGLPQLRADCLDVCDLSLPDRSVDVVTILEVLEHLADPQRAVHEILRVAQRSVVASVPSKEDDNPEHIRLFDKASLERLFLDAGADSVKIDFVLNHMIALVKVSA